MAFVAGAVWALSRRPFRVVVEDESMAPTLRPGDQLLCVRRRVIRRGDVVVVRPPPRGYEMVKRVTAIPGDPVGELNLGDDEYFVEGDDPTRSAGGRSFGPVGAGDIAGVVLLRYLPDPGVV